MAFISKSESGPTKSRLKMSCAIDEKHGVGDVVFLTKLSKEYFG